MENIEITIGNDKVFIGSENASKSFVLHDLDIDFIADDIERNEAKNGNFNVLVEEGIIIINWQIII